ncbi:MAG: hypothetical protein ACKVQC_04575 [Elusimicrobiota bacterium]
MKTKFGVSYYGNRFLNHAEHDLKEIAECCDYVVHTVNEADLTYHKLALQKICNASRKLNLEVWVDPWGLGGVFGGEAFSRFLLDHRDSWQKMSDGKIVPLACLNRFEWRSYMKEWVLSVRDMGGQVIFWDEPHVAVDFESEMKGVFSCTCDCCKDLYRKKMGEKMPLKLTDETRQFRRDTLREFLNEMMEFSHAKGLQNALCLYAFKGIPEYDRIWKEAAALPELDIFGCDPYWRWHGDKNPFTHVSEFSKYVVEHANKNNKGSQVWVQAMRLPAQKENELAIAVDAAVQAGISHVAAWSFDGGELLDPILSENPKEVWKVLKQVYLKYKV